MNQPRLAEGKRIVPEEVARCGINLLWKEEEVGCEREDLVEESKALLSTPEAE